MWQGARVQVCSAGVLSLGKHENCVNFWSMCDTNHNYTDQPPCQLEVPLPPQRCATAGQRNMAVRNDCVCWFSCDVWRVLTVCHTGSGEAFTMATAEIAAELVKAYNANRTVNLTRIKATVAGKHNLSHVPKVLFSLVCVLGVRLEMRCTGGASIASHVTELRFFACALLCCDRLSMSLVHFPKSTKTNWHPF